MVDEPVAWDSFVMPAIVVADEPVAVEQPVMEPLEALVAVADVQPFYAAEPLAEPNAAEEPDAVLFVEPAVEAVVEAEVIVAEEPAVSSEPMLFDEHADAEPEPEAAEGPVTDAHSADEHEGDAEPVLEHVDALSADEHEDDAEPVLEPWTPGARHGAPHGPGGRGRGRHRSIAVAVEESFSADSPGRSPVSRGSPESEEWAPVASEELLADDEAFVAEPAAEVDQPPAEEAAEPWFVADVQEPPAPEEPAPPKTDTWSGRAARLVVRRLYAGPHSSAGGIPRNLGWHRRSGRSPRSLTP